MMLTVEERFWAKVEKRGAEECWPWVGGKDRSGRGRFMMPDQSHTSAARAFFLLQGRELGRFDFACHHCDNPNCVNPAHLYLGTPATNMQDKMARGRHRVWQKERVTHCPKGHPYEGENLVIEGPTGSYRRCRVCSTESKRRYKERNRDKVLAAGREYMRRKYHERKRGAA